jgi:hypothetical protein
VILQRRESLLNDEKQKCKIKQSRRLVKYFDENLLIFEEAKLLHFWAKDISERKLDEKQFLDREQHNPIK